MESINIVCDTNIWYEFAKGTIDHNDIKNQNLIATFVNITELAQTPNMTENPELFISTLTALKKHYSGVIKSNPYEHLIEIFFNDFKPDHSLANKILSGFDALMTIELDSIPHSVLNKTRADIEKVKIEKQSISEPINEGLLKIRENIKKNGGKKQRRKISTISSWKQFISDTVLSYSIEFLDKEYNIDIQDPAWSLFECLLLTFESYFLELELSSNRKFDINDWGDLINLVYVQPNKQYWTFEKKWNNIFKDSVKLSKYVFKKNAT